jgi:hypothetical protein
MANELQEVWDHIGESGGQTLGDACDIERGIHSDEDRPFGVCVVCKKFGDNAFIHESPATAACCRGCDAYRGDINAGPAADIEYPQDEEFQVQGPEAAR